MENEVDKVVKDTMDYMLEIEKTIKETEDEFVYQLISPYCETVVEKKLSKRELKNILHKGMKVESSANKIIAEIESQEKWLLSAGYNAYNIDIAFKSILSRIRKELLDK